MKSKTITLKRGRERSLRLKHPWIFSGAIQYVGSDVEDGDLVRVSSLDGEHLGWALWNSVSQIVGRVVSWEAEFETNNAWIDKRVSEAFSRRKQLAWRMPGNAYRLIFAEADLLPGIIVDIYDQWAVLQCSVLGMERFKNDIARTVIEMTGCRGVYERSDLDVRIKERLKHHIGFMLGEELPGRIEIEEGGARFWVDPHRGAKTGWYLDQRENRLEVARWIRGGEVLNTFSYTGAFGILCLKAHPCTVINVDASASFLALGQENAKLNEMDTQISHIRSEVAPYLRQAKKQGKTFDAIILDPPKFVYTMSDFDRGCRAYKDINLYAMWLLRKGGILATFSCSGLVSEEIWQKIVFRAACDANREVRYVEKLGQSPDHPILLNFPEGSYLNGLICEVW